MNLRGARTEVATGNKTIWFLALRIGRGSGRTRAISWIALLAICFSAAAGNSAPHRASYRFHNGVALNDISVSPGEVRGTNRNDVCGQKAGFTDEFRNTTEKMKDEVYADYGVDQHKVQREMFCTGGVICDTDEELAEKNKGHKTPLPLYEIDHLDSLQLDGADTTANLMPQPYYAHPGAHEKDTLENWARKQVCAGKIELTDAQRRIATDWYQFYLDAGLHKAPKGTARAEYLKRKSEEARRLAAEPTTYRESAGTSMRSDAAIPGCAHTADESLSENRGAVPCQSSRLLTKRLASWMCCQGDACAPPTPLGVALYRIGVTRMFGVKCAKESD